MKISLIVGMTKHRVIGKNNTLPWHYPEDLQYFKKITTGHVIVMGYNTYLSLGRPLPQRRNIVLSKIPLDGIETYVSRDALMQQLEHEKISEFFVIGGASVYTQFIPMADVLYLTEIKKEYDGDIFFPPFEDKFVEVSREVGIELDFVVYKRK